MNKHDTKERKKDEKTEIHEVMSKQRICMD